jgi:multidrug transporter EmrE-like cation transporter
MFIIVNMEEWRAAVCFVTLSLAINDRCAAARSTVTLLCTLYCSLMYYLLPLPVQKLPYSTALATLHLQGAFLYMLPPNNHN